MHVWVCVCTHMHIYRCTYVYVYVCMVFAAERTSRGPGEKFEAFLSWGVTLIFISPMVFGSRRRGQTVPLALFALCVSFLLSNAVTNACEAGCWCEAGQYSAADPCTDCAAGKFSAAGASVCTNCAAGKYSAAGASVCTNCQTGKYQATAGVESVRVRGREGKVVSVHVCVCVCTHMHIYRCTYVYV